MINNNLINQIHSANLLSKYGKNIANNLNILANINASQKYVVCNAEESEPGNFKDRDLLFTQANQLELIHGMSMVGEIIGATVGYIYVRYEYIDQITILEEVLNQAYKNNLLDQNNFKIYITHGAGSYISSEETALLESIEGKKAFPRFKPPFITNVGLYGCPTGVYNVETFINIAKILKSQQLEQTISISGHINNPGIYKLSLGTRFKDLLTMAGGVKNNNQLKAVMLGGLSSPVMPSSVAIALTLDYKAGSVIIMDETTCMVEVLSRITKFYMDESCGQCSPCREGSGWVHRIVNKIYKNNGTMQDLELLSNIANNMSNNTICGLGRIINLSVESFIKHFKEEFIAKVKMDLPVYE